MTWAASPSRTLIESHPKDRPQTLRTVVRQIELDVALDDARFQMPQ